jgi:hypothetical protein
MKRLLAVLIFATNLYAQQVTRNIHVGGKTWPFSVVIIPQVVSLTCDKTVLNPGDVSTCTITLDLPSAGGLNISPYTADSPLVLSPASLVVPIGATSMQFTVTMPK